MALLDEALDTAESEEVKQRVEKASIGALRWALDPVWYSEDAAKVAPDQLEQLRPLVARFLTLCEKHQIDMVSEREPFATARGRLEKLLVGGR